MPSWYKLSKIYVGQDQVRPSMGHKSFDFRTMSLADLTAAWFTYQWFNGASVGIDNTKWVYATADGQAVLGYPVDLSTASSLLLKTTFYWFSWSWCGWPRHWISTSLQESEWNTNFKVACYLNFATNSWYRYQSIYVWWSYKARTDLWNIATGEYECTLNINFTTWLITWNMWLTTLTYTMTSAEIAAARTSSYINLVSNYNWGKQMQMWSAEWDIQ